MTTTTKSKQSKPAKRAKKAPKKVSKAKTKKPKEIIIGDDYVPSDDEAFMNDRQKQYFREKLLRWKDDILRESKETERRNFCSSLPGRTTY